MGQWSQVSNVRYDCVVTGGEALQLKVVFDVVWQCSQQQPLLFPVFLSGCVKLLHDDGDGAAAATFRIHMIPINVGLGCRGSCAA